MLGKDTVLVGAIALAVLFAGCLAGGDAQDPDADTAVDPSAEAPRPSDAERADGEARLGAGADDEDPPPKAPYPERGHEELEREGSVGTGVHGPQYSATDLRWIVEPPATLTALRGNISWEETANDLTVRVIPPEGPVQNETNNFPVGTTQAFEADTLRGGTYEIVVLARGATVADTVTLQLNATHVPEGWIDLHEGPPLEARATERIGGLDNETVHVDLSNVYGAFEVRNAERIYLEAQRWGEGADAFEARQNLKDTETHLEHENATLRGSGAPASYRPSGVDWVLKIPSSTAVTGEVHNQRSTMNLTGLRTGDDFTARSYDGDIEGDVVVDGERFEATSPFGGAMDLTLRPENSTRVSLSADDSSRFVLDERPDVRWNLTIYQGTGDGKAFPVVNASLDEAVLQETEHGKQLVTPDAEDRPIHVEGSISVDDARLVLRST